MNIKTLHLARDAAYCVHNAIESWDRTQCSPILSVNRAAQMRKQLLGAGIKPRTVMLLTN